VTVIHQPALENRLTFFNEQQLPAVIKAGEGESLRDLLADASEELAAIKGRYGAILFRGFNLRSAEDFHAAAAQCFGNMLRPYLGGISPRGEIMSGVYESTRYPSHLSIPQHNEMSYVPDPPRALAFFCDIEPVHGGDTPLADSRLIYERIPASVLARFGAHGIRYHRHLYGPRRNVITRTLCRVIELHTSWIAAFGTDDRSEVERICAEQGATVDWNWEESALITNTLPAVRKHPETGEMLWFNQASTFVATPQRIGWARWLLYHASFPRPHRRPFHATLGNGDPIPIADLNRVNAAIGSATVRFRWQRGDFLLVDNFLVAHGRMPYRGERRILVAIH
jgi:alpha-ketoglutarate-dependent taurine dioxygenase